MPRTATVLPHNAFPFIFGARKPVSGPNDEFCGVFALQLNGLRLAVAAELDCYDAHGRVQDLLNPKPSGAQASCVWGPPGPFDPGLG